MKEQINNWLKDSNRSYDLGLSIFAAFASGDIKKKYGEFLNSGANKNLKTTDQRFCMLTNKVTDIYNKVRLNPEVFKDITFGSSLVQTKTQVQEIVKLRDERNSLQSQITELQESGEDKSSEIETLEETINQKNTEIDDLKSKLKEQGLKVLDVSDLPPTIKTKHDRIKDIVPLMAAIHGELKDTNLTDEQRKLKAEELCSLDDERRTLWDDIDNYLNDKSSVVTEEKQLQYSEDSVAKGMQIAKRIERLKENIERNKVAAESHKTKNKPHLEQKALDKVAAMEHELAYLEKIVSNET